MNRRITLRRMLGATIAVLALGVAPATAMAAQPLETRCQFEGVTRHCTVPDMEASITSSYQGHAKVKGRTCPPGAMCLMAGERQDAFTYYQQWVWEGRWVLRGAWYNSKRDAGTVVWVEPWTDGWVWTRTAYDWRTRSYDWKAMRADKLTKVKMSNIVIWR